MVSPARVGHNPAMAEADARAFGMDPADHVAVANPIAPNQSLLRMSLLPELRGNVIENSKHQAQWPCALLRLTTLCAVVLVVSLW